jgi:DNA polymerase delta subunit 4
MAYIVVWHQADKCTGHKVASKDPNSGPKNDDDQDWNWKVPIISIYDLYSHNSIISGDVSKPSTSKKDVDEDQQVLKNFDLTWEYGPCMGITRMERWNRADKHELNPPQSIKDLIEQHKKDKLYTEW